MEQQGNSIGSEAFAAAPPELAEKPEKYEGLFGCPASDGNFTSALHGLSVAELERFRGELITRNLDEHCHKGRINAAAKEIRQRNTVSPETLAVERMTEDIITADNQYGDGMVYDIDRIENEIRFWQNQTGAAFVEMGKRFIRIKAHEGHGKFLKSLDRLGMTVRPAQYMMLAARKFSNTNLNSQLEPTKLRILSILDEDDIKTLELGGSVKGMTLDDIDRMSTRELRKNFREEKEKLKKEKEARKKERTAFEQSMLQKDAKINELDMRLSGQEPPTKEQIAKTALDALNRDYTAALGQVNSSLRSALSLLVKAEKEGKDKCRR